MSLLYNKIRSALGRRGTLIAPETEYVTKIYPTLSFDELNNIHIGDPDVGTAIDLIAGQVCHGGFETSMDPKYAIKTVDGRTAKELVDDRCQEFGLDQITKENVADVVGYGESVIWKGGPQSIKLLARVMPASIRSFNFSLDGMTLENIETYKTKLSINEVIRYSYNRIGKQPVGFGVLQALGTALLINGETRAPFAEIKARVQSAMVKQIEEYSAPNQMWVLPDAPKADMPTYKAMIQRLKKGERIAYNKAGAQVINAVAERMRGMDMYVEKLWNSFYLALQTPIPQLFAGGQLTQASALAALGVAEIGKIDDLRRYIKRVNEQEIFALWMREEGLDPLRAKVRMNWRLMQRPDSNVLLPLVVRVRELKDISRTEMRTVLSDMGLPITPEYPKDELEEPMPEKTGDQRDTPGLPISNQPVTSVEKKHEARGDEHRMVPGNA